MAIEAKMNVTLEIDTQRYAADLVRALGPKLDQIVKDARFQIEAGGKKYDSALGIRNAQAH